MKLGKTENLNKIKSSEISQKGRKIFSIIREDDGTKKSVFSKIKFNVFMLKAKNQIKKASHEINKQPLNSFSSISEKDLLQLKNYIYSLGIDDVGFVTVPSYCILKGQEIYFKNAIVMIKKYDINSLNKNDSFFHSVEREMGRSYYQMNFIANKVKEFLNKKGYNAVASSTLEGNVNYPLLAQEANLGYIGKNGLLITPKLGPSIRISAVYTDIENLPLAKENDYIWIRDFCNTCNRCVRKCPTKAIFLEPVNLEKGLQQTIDYKKCSFSLSFKEGCNLCVSECVFSKADFENIKIAYFLNK